MERRIFKTKSSCTYGVYLKHCMTSYRPNCEVTCGRTNREVLNIMWLFYLGLFQRKLRIFLMPVQRKVPQTAVMSICPCA
jgi:hypothetical protein